MQIICNALRKNKRHGLLFPLSPPCSSCNSVLLSSDCLVTGTIGESGIFQAHIYPATPEKTVSSEGPPQALHGSSNPGSSTPPALPAPGAPPAPLGSHQPSRASPATPRLFQPRLNPSNTPRLPQLHSTRGGSSNPGSSSSQPRVPPDSLRSCSPLRLSQLPRVPPARAPQALFPLRPG